MFSIGHDLRIITGFDIIVTAEGKRSSELPEYWNPHITWWAQYQNVVGLVSARFQYLKYPSRALKQGRTRCAVKDDSTWSVRAISMRVAPADTLIMGVSDEA